MSVRFGLFFGLFLGVRLGLRLGLSLRSVTALGALARLSTVVGDVPTRSLQVKRRLGDEPVVLPRAAFGATFPSRCGDLLPLFNVFFAIITVVFVDGHPFPPQGAKAGGKIVFSNRSVKI